MWWDATYTVRRQIKASHGEKQFQGGDVAKARGPGIEARARVAGCMRRKGHFGELS